MTSAVASQRPRDARAHLRDELARILDALRAVLLRQRSRGRTPLTDPVRGQAIEDGEAEGLIAQIWQAYDPSSGPAAGRRPGRPDILTRMDIAAHSGASFPLLHAARRFDLNPIEYDALVLALAVECDARFGRLIAYLNDHVAQTRPTLGLALARPSDEPATRLMYPLEFLSRPLVQDGLLLVEGDAPAPGLTLRLAPEIARRLAGEVAEPETAVVATPPELGLLPKLVLREEDRRFLESWCARWRAGHAMRPLILAGCEGSGRHTMAKACVGELGRSCVSVHASPATGWSELTAGRREVRWHDGALVVCLPDRIEGAVDWPGLWQRVESLKAPLIVTVDIGHAEQLAHAAPFEPAMIQLEAPDDEMAVAVWHRLLPRGVPVEPEAVHGLASRFRFTPGRILRCIQRATTTVALRPEGQRHMKSEDLFAACREIGSGGMSGLAEKLPLPFTRADLIVPPEVDRELSLAVAWIQQRRRVLDEWGFGARMTMGRGLTALFSGPPGVGKTMGAQVLARELDLDLYRVDLSRVLSKWIGETERNLSQLFDEAQASGCVLFFDEADALFGKRSEVKDAHDRYANVESGYLLQRMEQNDTPTILATNRPADLDDAFLRRFHVNLQFPLPDEPHRLLIWRGMVPQQATLADDVDLSAVAAGFELSGGEIRNAMLAAAYMAAGDGGLITQRHVRQAAAREMTKAGRVVGEEGSES